MLLLSASVLADNTRIVRGTVEDQTGEPLIGVSVQLKGTLTGTITDFDGKFSLTIPDRSNQILVISYVGFEQQEINVGTKSEYKIILKENSMELSEVVVTGYGIQQRRSLTSAVSTVRSETAVAKEKGKATTWKRSGMTDNSIRLQVGAEDYILLESAQIAVSIDGFRVRVLIDCFFYNDKGNGLEGTFKLKLPTDATPFYFAFGETEYLNQSEDDKKASKSVPFTKYDAAKFSLNYQEINERGNRSWNSVKEARIVSKQKAARAYEQTVSAGIDPALMEWGGADMFSCKVFPLSNNRLHQVVIGYDLYMTEALGFREYIMSLPKVMKDLKLDIAIFDSPLLQAEIPSTLMAENNIGNRTYYSSSNPKEKELIFRYNTAKLVVLVQSGEDLDDNKDENGYVYREEEIDVPYFAANYKVDLPEILQENLPTDAVFLLDLSISSNPDKFNVWLKLMDEILDKNRDIIKRFAVLSFNINTKWYTPYFQKNDYYNKERFLEYANTLALEGATDIYSALKEGSNPSWVKEGKKSPKHIFLMSDADCNWGETNTQTFKALINAGDRVHTYKTGLSGTNSSLLNYLSKISGGFAFTVTGEEEAALTAKSFRYKPWNIDNITVEGVEDFLISGQPT